MTSTFTAKDPSSNPPSPLTVTSLDLMTSHLPGPNFDLTYLTPDNDDDDNNDDNNNNDNDDDDDVCKKFKSVESAIQRKFRHNTPHVFYTF